MLLRIGQLIGIEQLLGINRLPVIQLPLAIEVLIELLYTAALSLPFLARARE